MSPTPCAQEIEAFGCACAEAAGGGEAETKAIAVALSALNAAIEKAKEEAAEEMGTCYDELQASFEASVASAAREAEKVLVEAVEEDLRLVDEIASIKESIMLGAITRAAARRSRELKGILAAHRGEEGA